MRHTGPGPSRPAPLVSADPSWPILVARGSVRGTWSTGGVPSRPALVLSTGPSHLGPPLWSVVFALSPSALVGVLLSPVL